MSARVHVAAAALLIALGSSAGADPAVAVWAEPGKLRVVIDPSMPLDGDVTLRVDDGPPLSASELQHVAQPIDLVIVLCTSRDWLQRAALAKDKRDVMTMVADMFGPDGPRNLAAPGSTYTVITYDRSVRVPQGRVALEEFDKWGLGTVGDFEQEGRHALPAIALGIQSLIASEAQRKALVVIGDGYDDFESKLDPIALRQQARDHDIHVFSVVIAQGHGQGDRVQGIAEQTYYYGELGDLVGPLATGLRALRDRYTATFEPGLLRWDGRVHRFALHHRGNRIAVIEATLPAATTLPAPERPIVESWVAAAIGGAGVAMIAGCVIVLRRRRSVAAVSP